MTKKERNFLSDNKDALNNWRSSIDQPYHTNDYMGRYLCIDIYISDFDEWLRNKEKTWNAIDNVCRIWGASKEIVQANVMKYL